MDDLELFELMLKDTERAPALYRPTNFWANHLAAIADELRTEGLERFRARPFSRLASFGGSDLRPRWRYLSPWMYENRLTRAVPAAKHAAASAERLLNEWVFDRLLKLRAPYGLSIEKLQSAAFRNAEREATALGIRTLSSIEVSTIGSPEDVFRVNDKTYTWNFIEYYLRYLFAAQFVDFNKHRVVVELGAGSGTSIELLKKLHPHLAFVLFDIPPALYVGHQYLRSVFGTDLVTYHETREMTGLPELEAGRIYVFGSWKFPLLDSLRGYLFWNAASFQEMEPPVALNYLATVRRGANAVYLNEMMEGQAPATAPGQLGVLEQTKLEHYRAGLEGFDLCARQRARTPIGDLVEYNSYEEAIFVRRT